MNGCWFIAALLTLAACGSQPAEQAEAPAKSETATKSTIPAIAPGTYSDAPKEGDGQGWQVTLADGERSKTAAIAHCAPECGTPASVPLRMGMGGMMAEFASEDGRTIPLAIRPHGQGIEVAADWGEGLESHKLVRVVGGGGAGDN